jgi:hypothetical protein
MAGNPVYPDYSLKITNWDNWGKLVKTWATGDNASDNTTRMTNGTYPWPTTIHELKHQMEKAGAGTVPANFVAVQFVQMSAQLLIIALPAAPDIVAAETKIRNIQQPDYYTVARFYKDDCGGVELKCTYGQNMTFNNQRVGEYVVSYCG